LGFGITDAINKEAFYESMYYQAAGFFGEVFGEISKMTSMLWGVGS